MGEKSFRLERPFQIHTSYVDGVRELVSSGKFLATAAIVEFESPTESPPPGRSWRMVGPVAIFGITQVDAPTETAAYIGPVDPVTGVVTFDTAKVTWKGRMAYGDAKIYTGLLMWELDHAFNQVMEKQKRKRWSPR